VLFSVPPNIQVRDFVGKRAKKRFARNQKVIFEFMPPALINVIVIDRDVCIDTVAELVLWIRGYAASESILRLS